MKKILCLALALVLSLGILAGCSSNDNNSSGGNSNASSDANSNASSSDNTKTDKKYVIGASFSQTNITPFGNYLYKDLVALCEEKGWELVCMDAERDATKEAQNVDTLLLQDLDLFLFWPYDREAAVVSVQRAKEQGLPVVILNADVAEEGRQYTDAYVGPDQKSVATSIAKYLVEQTDGKANIAVVDGTAGTTQYLLRMEGFEEYLADYPDMKIIAHEYSAGDRAKAITFTENFLTTYGDDLDAIYCPGSDNVAIGVAQVLKEAGRDDILVLSIDGMQEALDQIEEGWITMTVMQKPAFEIEKFGEVAEKIFAGETIEDRLQYNRFVLITKDNLDEEPAEY